MATDWELESLTAKWQARWWQASVHHAERRDGRPKFFIHFAYPGISGYLHVGHMRGFTYSDVLARYKRMTGHDVLFPAGFHASGIPAVAFAKEVERGEKTEYLRANGYAGNIQELADPQRVVAYFAEVYTHEYWKKFGFLIDERRNCTTIDPGYNRFIHWQFRRLKDLGYLIQKPHYAPYCPVAGPVAVDKSETDIKTGGGAEVLEFLALRFHVPATSLPKAAAAAAPDGLVLPCATLRPETVFGATNVWLHPDAEYELVRVYADGAVSDDDASEIWLVSPQGSTKCQWQFERAEALGIKVLGKQLLGTVATAPLTGAQVPVVAGSFVDPLIATGVVMSVPAHAPFDWAAYVDAGLLDSLGGPPVIVDVEGVQGIPAQLAANRHGAKTQADRKALERATEEVYAEEFNKGRLNERCGAYAGERVKAIKDRLRAEFVAAGHARIVRQFSEPVISRAGQVVDIRRIPDQDFIHYADAAWTAKAKAHAASMTILPERYKDEMPNVLDWFGDRACVRRGAWLGTPFPFKPDWVIEPISDSTFYPWYYVVSLYVNEGRLAPEDLTDAFFDYVFNGKGKPTGPKATLWEVVRADALHWGPVDINLGGKEHQTVHFPVYIMNQVALLEDPAQWPQGIFVNWWVTQQAGAKISKSKGGAEPIPGAAKKYGVDPMRLYYCHVGSPHVDIEWDPSIVLTYRQHVLRLGRLADELMEVTGGAGPMDAWLEAAMAQHLATVQAAYERYDLRLAASELVYAVPESLRWYQRRGGNNGPAVQTALRQLATALSPMLPHVAEEMFERAGGSGLCMEQPFPEPGAVDAAVLAADVYLRGVLEDIQTVRKLAGTAATRLVLYTTPKWKHDAQKLAVQLAGAGGKFPMGDFMKQLMDDPDMRARGKEAQQFAGKAAQQAAKMSEALRTVLLAGVDETEVLREAVPFIEKEIGVGEVAVYAADDKAAPPHPKQAIAAPLKPGIAL
jgi:leucyl-tRNA synthetase